MLGKWIRAYCSKRWGWLADPGSESRSYFYGFPQDGTVEPNVLAQWLFDESSGSIVDTVAALTLSATGTPIYGVTTIGSYANLLNGITYEAGERHSTAAGSSASPGLNDFTYEMWFTTVSTAGENVPISSRDGLGRQTMYIALRPAIRMCTFFWVLPTVSQQGILLTVPAGIDIGDGGFHHFRVRGVRTASLEMFMDGVSMGTADITAQSAYTLASNTLYIGNYTESDLPLNGTLFELRISANSTNDSRVYNGN